LLTYYSAKWKVWVELQSGNRINENGTYKLICIFLIRKIKGGEGEQELKAILLF
jgi:hypothetical protein